jgi:outer membrane protein
MIKALLAVAAFPALLLATGAAAQEQAETKEPLRFRLALGPQVKPQFPGSKEVRFLPFYDISIARGDEPFEFEAADESAAINLLKSERFAIGPAIKIEGSRRRNETDLPVDEVGTTVEAGAIAEFWLGSSVRAHGEVRKGVNGHRGVVSNLMLDYVARDGDRWLFSLGPRVSLSDGKYQRAFFGVNPAASARTGLATFTPDGGVHSVGASATTIYALSPSWGVQGYARYDRLVADAARSPIVRTIGSRNQFSAGAALTFTFQSGIR